jgi:hypothetical protein
VHHAHAHSKAVRSPASGPFPLRANLL